MNASALLAAYLGSPDNLALARLLADQLERDEAWSLLDPHLAAWESPEPLQPVAVLELLIRALLVRHSTLLAEEALNRLLDQDAGHDISALKQAFEKADHLPRRWQRNPVTAHGEARPDLETLSDFRPEPPRREHITFADVGGMDALKASARLRIIEPFRQSELFARYGRKSGGGILLYGPPGCGKTHFARAVAGECQAAFFNVGLQDILNLYVGQSERNIHRLFETARGHRPAILFVDELDALGRKRDLMRSSPITSTVNAFLAELDGLSSDNEGLLVLGATNAPWDIDSAFKRPGRFDQVLFVPPPDEASRKAILTLALGQRPVASDVDPGRIAIQTGGFSGADLTALVNDASDRVLDAILSGQPERPISAADLASALKNRQASTHEWMATAKQYVTYSNDEGQYDDIAAYLDQRGPTRRRLGFW